MSVIHLNGIGAVWRRQLASLLGSPLGYIFILAFVLGAGAFLFLPDDYYARNLADLGPLFKVMPWGLVFLVPALAMGAWASEREHATEELILTLPLSIADAVFGKYLAVVTFFTIALLCSLSNVVVLMWLGEPDLGLIAANYLGWWLAGLACAAFGLWASVQVSMLAVAWVVGAIYCAIIMLGAGRLAWFDPFNRGVVSFGGVVIALAAIAAGLGLATLQLASRRWRPSAGPTVVNQALSAVFGIILAVNLGRIAATHGVDGDVSSEGLSSISVASARIVSAVDQPVSIVAFISEKLPAELMLKAKEVDDKLHALARSSGGKVTLDIYRPADALDKSAVLAAKHYGVKPFKAMVENVRGRGFQDVFLGAAVVSGGRSQVITSFNPGLSVEYELVRAVRGVGRPKKPVLGLAMTDLKVTTDFDFQTNQMREGWDVIDELRKQYEVREVNLDSPVADEVVVLVVPLPSSLSPAQVERLHDYIWAGRPALLLEDPLPMFSGPALAPSMPKHQANNPYQQQGQDQPQKADLKPLYRALGLDFDLNGVTWSSYNPLHKYRDMIEPAFVWCMRDLQGVAESPITTGIDSMLMPYAGALYVSADKFPKLTVTPLLMPIAGTAWGKHQFSDYIMQGFMGMQRRQPQKWIQGDPAKRPFLAAEVTGIMPSAYPKEDPGAKPEEKPDAKDEKQDEKKPAAKAGVPSAKPVHVIVIADTDFATNQFFAFYRNADNQFSGDELVPLRNLRNVQFLANAVDVLSGDLDFLGLRTRGARSRPLAVLDEVQVRTSKVVRDETQLAETDAQAALDKVNARFQEKQSTIDTKADVDENTKANEKMMFAGAFQRQLDAEIEAINQKKQERIDQALVEQDRAITAKRRQVQWLALLSPGTVLFALVLLVFGLRLHQERTHIPASRKRSQP